MDTRTVTRVYSNYDKAAQIVNELEAADIPHRDISILSSNKDNRHSNTRPFATGKTGEELQENEVLYDTAVGGGVVGAGAGLLAGLGLLAIPGFGPVAAVGWLGAMLAGGVIGTAASTAAEGIAEALSSHGVDDKDAREYAEQLRLGGTLVAVKCNENQIRLVESIMGVNETGFEMGEEVDPETGRRIA